MGDDMPYSGYLPLLTRIFHNRHVLRTHSTSTNIPPPLHDLRWKTKKSFTVRFSQKKFRKTLDGHWPVLRLTWLRKLAVLNLNVLKSVFGHSEIVWFLALETTASSNGTNCIIRNWLQCSAVISKFQDDWIGNAAKRNVG